MNHVPFPLAITYAINVHPYRLDNMNWLHYCLFTIAHKKKNEPKKNINKLDGFVHCIYLCNGHCGRTNRMRKKNNTQEHNKSSQSSLFMCVSNHFFLFSYHLVCLRLYSVQCRPISLWVINIYYSTENGLVHFTNSRHRHQIQIFHKTLSIMWFGFSFVATTKKNHPFSSASSRLLFFCCFLSKFCAI